MINRFLFVFTLIIASCLNTKAQRLDGCVTPETQLPSKGVSREDRNRGLQAAGYSLTKASLLLALRDPREEVRGSAAEAIVEDAERDELAPIMQAWLLEKDLCARGAMLSALTLLMRGIAWDPAEHPGGQPRVTLNQPCTPSPHAILSATLEQATDRYYSGPVVRITYQNQTGETLGFAKTVSPLDLFSATVLGPTGEHGKVAEGSDWLYEPLRPGDGRGLENTFRLVFVSLPPGKEVSWTWRIGADFDMSAPGIYQVSFGGRIKYLDTSVCSNVLSFVVE